MRRLLLSGCLCTLAVLSAAALCAGLPWLVGSSSISASGASRRVAELFGKADGAMCNSGSSALYLALELLDLPRGAEVVTCALTWNSQRPFSRLLAGFFSPPKDTQE